MPLLFFFGLIIMVRVLMLGTPDPSKPAWSLANGLGETVSKAGLRQIRFAETEKYPHVTYFFNGGREEPFAGEERSLTPSPKVATYDLQPEMSAPELTGKVVAAIDPSGNKTERREKVNVEVY